MIQALVEDASENGRRAQAVVAGLMDAFAGAERVESGRVNDPSRRHPGDVCVRAAARNCPRLPGYVLTHSDALSQNRTRRRDASP